MTVSSDNVLEYFVRRCTLEKGYAVQADEVRDDKPIVRSIAESHFSYPLPVVYFEELDPLRAYFDVLLVRADGFNFNVLGLKKVNGKSTLDDLEQETLLSVGESCLGFAGKTNGAQMPVNFEIVEIYEWDVRKEKIDRLAHLPVAFPIKRKVGINVYVIGFSAGQVWSRGNLFARLGRGRYFKRILSERYKSEHQIIEEVMQSGMRLGPILIGAVVGVVLAFGLRYLFGILGAEDGRLYGGIDYIMGVVATSIAVLARRIRANSAAQGATAAFLYVALLYGVMLYLGASFSIWMVVNAVFIVGLAFMLGNASEMA